MNPTLERDYWAQFPNRRTYFCLAIGFTLLVMYGCFVPFEFRSLSLPDAIEKFQVVLSQPIQPTLNSDWLINIVMCIPVGFLWAGFWGVDRSRWLQSIVCIVLIPFLMLFSAGIEFTQLFIPKRVSSVQDIAANTFGGAVGCLSWLLFGNAFTDLIRRIDQLQGTANVWRKLVPIYLIGLILLHTTPFDLVDFGFLKVKWKDGNIRFIPFHFPEFAPEHLRKLWKEQFLEKTFFNIGYFFPAGLILAGLDWPRNKNSLGALKVIGAGFVLAAFIECLQLTVFSRAFEATDIITGTLAVAFGWSMSQLMTKPDGVIRLRIPLLLLWVVGLMVMNWQPFNFLEDAVALRSNRKGFNWMPFVDYYEHDYLDAFYKMFQKMLVFVPIGVLLTKPGPGLPWLKILIPSLALAVGIEAGQNYLPSHYPTISDVLIEPIGALAGMLLVRLVQKSRS
jgi:glycopeptide antibiotics resistance protein